MIMGWWIGFATVDYTPNFDICDKLSPRLNMDAVLTAPFLGEKN